MKIIYPEIEEYNKENNFYNYIENYINQFKNRKDKIEFSYLCAKEIIELTKENKELYENCVKCLELVRLWLKDENSINIQELKKIAYSISDSAYSISDSAISDSAYSISDSAYAITNATYSITYSTYSTYCVYLAKPELLPYIQNLTKIYLRTIKQFDIKEHNNTYHKKVLKQIINTDYEQLQDIDKNQVIDIINEYYDIEIDCFDFLTHKTIQKEFM